MTERISCSKQLDALLTAAALSALSNEQTALFDSYLKLLLRWNAKTNLTAVRDPEAIIRRHFLECIACAQCLPNNIHSLLDFGSGAGLPGIPISICRPDVEVTLAESQGKKAAFLGEAVRTLGLKAKVFSGRAEQIEALFDCVTLRAVDKMMTAVAEANSLLKPGGWLAVLTSEQRREETAGSVGPQYGWKEPIALPGSEQRILLLGLKRQS